MLWHLVMSTQLNSSSQSVPIHSHFNNLEWLKLNFMIQSNYTWVMRPTTVFYECPIIYAKCTDVQLGMSYFLDLVEYFHIYSMLVVIIIRIIYLSEPPRMSMEDYDKTSDAIRAARMYYYRNMTVEVIAHELTCHESPCTFVEFARQQGLVDIRIVDPNEHPQQFEKKITDYFKIKRAHVVSVPDIAGEAEWLERVAQYTANYLNSNFDSKYDTWGLPGVQQSVGFPDICSQNNSQFTHRSTEW